MGDFLIGFVLGAVLGAIVAIVTGYLRWRANARQMRETFSALAAEALDANAKRLGEQTGAALESKKALIDQAVKSMNDRLEQVRQFLQKIEAERKEDFGSLGSSVASLTITAGKLHEMLASTKRRGAWGERMAEDVLRLAGLVEGINYHKQSSEQAESGRPDFTFLLPNNLKVNMDVKFPLERYRDYLDSETDEQRGEALKGLVADVRNHIRTVAGRGYIDPKAPTVPYVIVFIASEQVYCLVMESDRDLIDEALKQKVVLTSPLTLYAMLAVMRQAAENANLMKTADEVITLLGQFDKQWQLYNEELDRLGQRIDSAAKQFELVRNRRSNALQKPLDKIDDLRNARALPEQQSGQRLDVASQGEQEK